jgi:hypothetical protein
LYLQILGGVSLAEFSSDAVRNTKVLKQAVADSIPGCSVDSISKLKVTAVTTASAVTLLAAAASSQHRAVRQLSGSAVTATYKVTVQHTIFSADTLAAELYRATTTGAFDRSLATYAAENAAVALRNAYSYELTTESVRSESSSDLSQILSTRAIVAVLVVSGVVFLVLVTAAAVYLARDTASTGVSARYEAAQQGPAGSASSDAAATEEEEGERQATSGEPVAGVLDVQEGVYTVLPVAVDTVQYPCPDAEL